MNTVRLKINVLGREQITTLLSEVNQLDNRTIHIKTTSSAGVAQRGVEKLGGTLEKTSTQANNLFTNMKKFALWYLIGNVISGIARSFNEAFEAMKAVDDELVVVRKVTGSTTAELQKLEKQAYATASAYGVAASKYLESVSAFSRAGYGDLADQLAELSVKTQLVGDTDAETANQFLLSVDAAYQYRGEVAKLSSVLDGANEIDNKYATSIQKIAEGMGIVAPVAKQAHMEVDELTAAIGTITAVTQRSGSEAARALRALILNIVGDTKTEIDEGVTWTTGEIAGLQEVIRLYANDAYEAAKATGSVINPMEAIAGLAQSMKDGLLTEQQLMSMVSDIGGKLRTSQLLALIQNWDMYQSMLVDYGNTIGSADREVENALDSWTRKSEILNNKWTELVSNMVDTEVIKGGLDVLIGFVDFLNTGIGRATVSAVAFGGAAIGVVAGIKAIHKAMAELNITTLANPLFLGVAGATLVLSGIIALADELNVTYEEQKEIVADLNAEYETMFGKDSEYQYLIAREQELTDIEAKRLAYLKAIEAEKKKALADEQREEWEKYKKEFKSSIENEKSDMPLLGQLFYDVLPWWAQNSMSDAAQSNLEKLENEFKKLNDSYNSGSISAKEYNSELQSLLKENQATYEKLLEYQEMFGSEFSSGMNQFLYWYERIIDNLNEYSESQVAASNETDATTEYISKLKENVEQYAEILGSLNSELDELQNTYSILQTAVDEYNSSGSISIDTYQKLLALEPKYLELISEENGQLKLNEQAYKALQQAQTEQLAVTQAQKLTEEALALLLKKDVTGLNELVSVTKTSTDATWDYVDALIAEIEALSAISGTHAPSTLMPTKYAKPQAIAFDYGSNSALSSAVESLKERIKLYREMSGVVDETADGEEKANNTTDERLESLQNIVSLRESELTLLEHQEASTDDQISKIKEIQAAIKDQVAYMESIGSSQVEINNLTAQWYSWQDRINDLLESDSEALSKYQEELWSELESAIDTTIDKVNDEKEAVLDSLDVKLERAKELRDTQIEALDEQLEAQEKLHDSQMSALDAQLEALQAERDTKSDQLTLEEKILAVQEAQAALANAQAERTVRYYNATTGAWEWGANVKNVKDAQEALKNAQQDLSDFRDDLAYNEAVQAIEDKKNALQTAYDFIVEEIKNRQNAIDAQYDATERDIKRQKSQLSSLYDSLANHWQSVGTSMAAPARSITEILNDIAHYGTPQMKAQIENINSLLAALGGYLTNFLGVDSSGVLGNYSPSSMGFVSSDSSGSENPIAQSALRDVARQVIQGYWGNGSARREALTNAGYNYDEVMAIVNNMLATGVYDAGGILKGLGGIKATKEDEIILPPEITKAMLSPSANSTFQSRLSELHYLYGIGMNRPQGFSEGTINRFGDQHNGDIYQYGNITLTESQAKGMTVFELARLSSNLNIYSDN